MSVQHYITGCKTSCSDTIVMYIQGSDSGKMLAPSLCTNRTIVSITAIFSPLESERQKERAKKEEM